MIHLLTKGGMGNQMFQYAFALKLQQGKTDEPIYLNGNFHPFSKDKRKHSLHHFCLTPHTKVCGSVKGYYLVVSMVQALMNALGFKNMLRFLKHRQSILYSHSDDLNSNGVYFASDIYSAPQIKTTASNKHVFGYFQTPDIVRGIEKEVRDAFKIKTPPSRENQKILDEITNEKNAVCLHVRRGDYSLYPQLQVCDEAYYAKAVKHACKILKNPVFYVFSTGHEDIEWVRANYQFDVDMRFVDLDNPDYEELRLMMACKHFIISNSTFSWWAAVLSNVAGDNKQVWAPATWLRGSDVKMTFDDWNII